MTALSVTIPAHNEAARITALLDSFEAQENKDFEVLIVDNNSTDTTAKLVQAFATKSSFQLRVLEEPQQGIGYARKRGMDDAAHRGISLLAGTDADSIVPPNWIQTIKTSLSGQYDCVFGLACYDTKYFATQPDLLRRIQKVVELRNTFAKHITIPPRGVNFALTRELYERVGGITQPVHADGRAAAGEDILLAKAVRNAGGKIGELRAVVATDPRRVLAAVLQNSPSDFHTATIGNPRDTFQLARDVANLPTDLLDHFFEISCVRYFTDFIVNHRNDEFWDRAKVFLAENAAAFLSDADTMTPADLYKKYESTINHHVQRLNTLTEPY